MKTTLYLLCIILAYSCCGNMEPANGSSVKRAVDSVQDGAADGGDVAEKLKEKDAWKDLAAGYEPEGMQRRRRDDAKPAAGAATPTLIAPWSVMKTVVGVAVPTVLLTKMAYA